MQPAITGGAVDAACTCSNATKTDMKDRTLSKTTNADVKMNDVVLVHMSDSLTDLTQPTDALHFTVLLHLNGSRQ